MGNGSTVLLPEDKRRLYFDENEIYWDFVLELLRDKGDWSKISSLNSRQAESVLEEVMKKGRIDCGGGVSLVQCPHYDQPTACFVYNSPSGDFESSFCFATAISQETKSPVRPWKDDYVVYHEKMLNNFRCGFFGLDTDFYQPAHNKALHFSQELYDLIYSYLLDLDGFEVSGYTGSDILRVSELSTKD